MDFLGEHKVKIDAKGRLRLPGALKLQMDPASEGRFVVNRGFEGCLALYPKKLWNKLIDSLKRQLNMFDKEHREFFRRFQGGATELSLDSADRLNFPNPLLQFIDVKSEVYLTPGLHTIEMWSAERYDNRLAEFNSDEYEQLAQKVMANIDLWGDNQNQ